MRDLVVRFHDTGHFPSVAQPGSVPVLGTGSRGFKSRHSDQTLSGEKIMKYLALVFTLLLVGCQDAATIVNENLTKAADNFEVNRRIVFYNGITNDYMLTIEGRCSIDTSTSGNVLHVVCKTGDNTYKKHFLGLSDNVTFFAEQLRDANVNAYHYRVTFKPQTIIPDIDFRGSVVDLKSAVTPDRKD